MSPSGYVNCRSAALMLLSLMVSSSLPTEASITSQTVQPGGYDPAYPRNHRVDESKQANKQHKLISEVAPMSLIPVDQPLTSSQSQHQSQSVVFEDDPSFNVNPDEDSSGQLDSMAIHEQSMGEQSPSDIPASHRDGLNIVFDSKNEYQKAANLDGQTKAVSSQLDKPKISSLSPVERRFGLFKKHHTQPTPSHYGAPQALINTANYHSASPYLSDCERCMVSLNGAPQFSGELQQPPLEPVTPTTPTILPVAPVNPMPQPSYPHPYPSFQHPLAPLKSKFLMKFPFFIKSGMQYEGQPSYLPAHPLQTHDYAWHHQPIRSQPQMSGSLYYKPAPQATTAYHCVQAYGAPTSSLSPFLGTSQQESSNVVSLSPGPTKSVQSGTKYQQQQQQSY